MRAPGESARGQNLSGRVPEHPGRGAVQRAAPEGPRDGKVVKDAAHLQSHTRAGTLKVPQTTQRLTGQSGDLRSAAMTSGPQGSGRAGSLDAPGAPRPRAPPWPAQFPPGRRVRGRVLRVESISVWAMTAAAQRRVNHLWSAGSTCQGAHSVLVWLSIAE